MRIINVTGLFLIVLTVSCVSGKKYNSLSNTSRQFMNERDALKEANINLEMKNAELEARQVSIEKEIEELKRQYTKVEADRTKTLNDLNNITARYNELLNAWKPNSVISARLPKV